MSVLEDRYRALVPELARARTELARARVAHARARIDGFQSSTATSIQGRDRDADAFAVDAYDALVQAEVHLELVDDERLLIRDLIKLERR